LVSFSEFFLSVWVFPKRRFFFRLSFSPHRSVNGTPLRALEFFSPQNLERTGVGERREREKERHYRLGLEERFFLLLSVSAFADDATS
jgi:hypothetical protein